MAKYVTCEPILYVTRIMNQVLETYTDLSSRHRCSSSWGLHMEEEETGEPRGNPPVRLDDYKTISICDILISSFNPSATDHKKAYSATKNTKTTRTY